MRYFALILMLITPSWAGAEPEKMECSGRGSFSYSKGTFEKLGQLDRKTFITIEDDIMSINYEDSGSLILTERNGRNFFTTTDDGGYAITVVVGGRPCSRGDPRGRNVSYYMNGIAYTYAEMLRCSCR